MLVFSHTVLAGQRMVLLFCGQRDHMSVQKTAQWILSMLYLSVLGWSGTHCTPKAWFSVLGNSQLSLTLVLEGMAPPYRHKNKNLKKKKTQKLNL